MFGQVEPLKKGTRIEAIEDGDIYKNLFVYEIEDVIAAGGNGIVYKAKNVGNGELVILKEYYPFNTIVRDMYYRRDGVIVKNGEDDSPFCSDFLDRARIEKKNNHGCSGIAKSSRVCLIRRVLCAHSIIEPDSYDDMSWDSDIVGIFVEMERFSNVFSYNNLLLSIKEELKNAQDGSDIQAELKELLSPDANSLSAYGIMSLVYDIIKSVASIHGNGWVHRDIKLDNILFEKNTEDSFFEGLAIMIDFGSAQELIPGTDPLHADKGAYPYTDGTTKGYQPPEILDENLEKYSFNGWTKKADIYQIGCIMYYLFCGELAEYTEDKLSLVLNKYDLAPDVVDMVKGVLNKSLASNPAHRYSSTRKYRREIENIQGLVSSKANIIRHYNDIKYKVMHEGSNDDDYEVIYDLFDNIMREIKNHDLYGEDDKECIENDELVAASIEELVGWPEKIAIDEAHSNYHRSVLLGVLYIRSVREFRRSGKTINFDPIALIEFAFSANVLLSNDLCMQLARESLRFSKNKSFATHSDSETAFSIKYKIIRMLDEKDELAKSNGTYIEVKYLLNENEKELDALSKASKAIFYSLKSEVAIYERDYAQALLYMDKAEEACDDGDIMNRIQHLIHKFDVLMNKMFLYNEAIAVMDQTMELLKSNSDSMSKIKVAEISAHLFLSKGGAYYNLNMHDKAVPLVKKANMLYNELVATYPNHKVYRYYLTASDDLLALLTCSRNKKDLMHKGDLKPSETTDEKRVLPSGGITFDRVSDSLRLLYDSQFIPSKCRPIPAKKLSKKTLDVILSSYGQRITADEIVAVLLDPRPINIQKSGVVFTKKGLCGSVFATDEIIPYDDIETVKMISNEKMEIIKLNGQSEEVKFALAKLLVNILNGEKSIRDYK